MQGFKDVTLKWQGEEFTIPAGDQLMLICQIEDALAGPGQRPAIVQLTGKEPPTHGRLSRAYGAALRYGGAQVSDAEIYLSMQTSMAEGDGGVAVEIQAATLGLLAIVSPPVYSRIMGVRTGDAPGK